MAMKASMYRQRDDSHYGSSQEQQIVKYVKDYAYFGNYMRDMERIAANAKLPTSVLENVAAIVEESDIRFEILDNFSYTIPHSGYKSACWDNSESH